MAYSYAQLASEAAWRDEVVPPALASMGRTVRTALGLPAEAIGFKGNNLHLNGGHRSRRWILTSQFCTDRTYTVTYAADRLGDQNWISAFDISAPPDILLPMCQRLDVAVRAGELEELAAWYGNLDGDQRVDGYNNILNRVASSDTSHLTHLHGTVLRQHANNFVFMAKLASVLSGADMFEQTDRNTATADTWRTLTLLENRPAAEYQLPGEPSPRKEANKLKEQLDRIEAKGVTLTAADLNAIVKGVADALRPDILALAGVVDANTRDAVADAAEGGAAAVRASS